MRTRRIVVASVMALALAVGALGWAQAPTGDYASGFGFWSGSSDGEGPQGPGSVEFEAIGTLPETGLAQGEFDYREATRNGEGKGFHANVFCINIDENNGWVGLTVETSTTPTVNPGDVLIAYVEDNGDGRGDLFDLDEADTQEAMECDSDDEDPTALRGNIYVADNGGFARNP
ncbi:MAG: hypothetical protein ACRDI1_08225 [Actinomycetota bacterium]